ncbi:MAG TPA: ATP-binding protein [Bacteroidia bacterium]|jgi:signal transduction histidine kinase/CHASE3 domain sensor protein|nr:ATP-binding protein [Bacteroidia bacterium]
MKNIYDRLILIGYVAAIAILGFIGFESFRSTTTYIASDKDVTNTHKIIETLGTIQTTLKDAENAEKGYIITSKNMYLDPYISDRNKLTKITGELLTIGGATPQQRKYFIHIDSLISMRIELLNTGIILRSSKNGFDAAQRIIASDTEKNVSDSINALIDRVQKSTKASLEEKEDDLIHNAGATGKFYFAGIVVCMLLLILTYMLHLNDRRKRNLAEQKLHDSQRRYEMIATNFPDGTINVLNRELKYVFANGKELSKFEIAPEDLIGTDYLTRFPPEKRNSITKELMDVFERKSITSTFEFTYRGLLYTASAVALWNSGNTEIDEILLVEQNITAQKRAEQDVRSSLEKEKHLNELTSLIVSIASHEFRTPLGTIISSTELIEKYIRNSNEVDIIRDKSNKHLLRIKSSVDHLVDILNSFISLEKLEQGKIEVKPTLFNIVLFSEDLIDELNSTLKPEQKITYKHIGNNTGVFLDNQMMKNVIVNLLSNASKYSPEGSTIEFITILNEQELSIDVIDHGMGIPETDQSHLFENFFRAKNAVNVRGTGLGLNIVKRYTDLMKGTITFKSTEGVGTTFTINIPTTNTLS